MNVIITGANGFVGRHLSDKLARKHELFLTSRSVNSDKADYLDLSDINSVKKYINKMSNMKIDVLVHTAGKLVSSGMTFDEQMDVFNENITITRNIVELIKKMEIKILINFSSMAVYPNESGIYNEKSEIRMSCNNDCLYGASKFIAENIFDYALKSVSQIIHLRLAQIYGKGMREDRIIPVMWNSIVNNNEVIVYGDGKRTSNFIHVAKVCGIIDKMIDTPDINGVFNVGDKNITYLQLAERLIKFFGNKTTKIIKIEQGSTAQFVLDIGKITSLWRNVDNGKDKENEIL